MLCSLDLNTHAHAHTFAATHTHTQPHGQMYIVYTHTKTNTFQNRRQMPRSTPGHVCIKTLRCRSDTDTHRQMWNKLTFKWSTLTEIPVTLAQKKQEKWTHTHTQDLFQFHPMRLLLDVQIQLFRDRLPCNTRRGATYSTYHSCRSSTHVLWSRADP